MAAQASAPLFERTLGSSPLVVSFPHSGTELPEAIAARLLPAALDLPDTDWFVPQLYSFLAELGASSIRATVSRYVVDLNRPPDGAALYPGKRETTVCPTETFAAEPLYLPGAAPDAAEVQERLEVYWRPYHQALEGLINAALKRHGRCILWDAHSIRSVVPELFAGRLPDLNLGTVGGRSCSAPLLEAVVAPLRAQSHFSFIVDGRFKGGYITRRYGNPAAHIEALQMEIAQCAYLEEQRVPEFDPARARALGALLRELQRCALIAVA